MVIYGEYNSSRYRAPSPCVWAYVSFTRLGIDDWVNFTVDSGANGVAIHLDDVRRMNIPPDLLQGTGRLQQSVGIGGTQHYYSVPGTLSFETASFPHIRCHLDINIVRDDPQTPLGIPSLLGRDFLNLCEVRLNYYTGLVSMEPVLLNPYGEILLL